MPTLRQALDRYLLIDRATSTKKTLTGFLGRFAASIGPDRAIDIIREEDIACFVDAMRTARTKYADHPQHPVEPAPLAPATIYRNSKMIKTFFRWCVDQGLIELSPAEFLINRRPKRPLGQGKDIHDDELDLLIAAARFKPRDHALVLLLAQSGCRAGEAAGLRLRDLDLEACSAFVDGKGAVNRKIYFGTRTAEALSTWLASRPKVAHDYVFISTRGHGPLTADSASLVVRRLCKTAGIRSLGAHSLRHRVGLKLARERVSPRVAQHYLGHSSVGTTMEYYTGVEEFDLRQAGTLLENRGDWPEQIKQKPAEKLLKKASSGGSS